MQSKDLGIDINRTIIIRAPAAFDSTYLARLGSFKLKLQSNSIIISVTTSTAIPGDEIGWTGTIRKEDDKSSSGLNFIVNVIDPDFISSYNLRFLAGRNFEMSDFPSLHFGNKIEPVILNKTAIAQLGFRIPEEAIGTAIYWGKNKCRVVGVIDDFHQQSFRNALQPIIFTANIGPLMSLKLGKGVNSDNLSHSISTIHEAWSSLFPDYPFDYFFLDEFYSNQYSNDKQVMSLFHVFCGLAILVSCLGLFGLSTLTTRQRTKEMGIRKILGAPTIGLITEMSREFLVLIILASVTAIPISYFGIGQWLQSFAFHIDLNGWLFIVPVLFILTIAVLTVSFQTIKAALANPIDSLKSE